MTSVTPLTCLMRKTITNAVTALVIDTLDLGHIWRETRESNCQGEIGLRAFFSSIRKNESMPEKEENQTNTLKGE
ncbi:hypothetical protein POVCU2_0030290 [Plasmodium ovale curtisi]|uniref:Uncharacterized protein n=1 Tax=Plasmodium ovale curtisi TaxID=864141 RepID=A0A1A8VXH4_PLAOA|nr:hypothetical protein POVCU2_0030290 [Plasmodium ovale curtisi]SBS94097.1 hypothetical protein POVCU1_027470 [Plasmodium ovale curtisi]